MEYHAISRTVIHPNVSRSFLAVDALADDDADALPDALARIMRLRSRVLAGRGVDEDVIDGVTVRCRYLNDEILQFIVGGRVVYNSAARALEAWRLSTTEAS